MKIVVTAEKSGQALARSELQIKADDDLQKGARRALKRLIAENRTISLFDPDVRVKFDKVE